MSKTFAVVFAGVPGSGKTPVAYYLSWKFNLPIFSNDCIRNEVKEDLLTNDINEPHALKEFHKRADERRELFLQTNKPIILDSSVDRRWALQKEQLISSGYLWYLINFELSKLFLEKLYKAKGYTADLDYYLNQHNEFTEQYSKDVNLQVSDSEFKGRLKLSAQGLQKFIDSL